MTPRTLPRQPWRGSMLCGAQAYDGTASSTPAYCAERKAEDLPLCAAHWDAGDVYPAPDSAVGAPRWAVRLLWQPVDGDVPVEATPGEIARYAAILDPVRGEQ